MYDPDEYKNKKQKYIELLGGVCVRCGTNESLEFDHIDPTTKLFTIGGSISNSEYTVLKELEKCQLLCTDCHHVKNNEDRIKLDTNCKHGTNTMYNIYGCRCELCIAGERENNIRRGRTRCINRSKHDPSTHGERLHYQRGCRCNLCKEASAEYLREWRNKQLQEAMRIIQISSTSRKVG